jgi:hypothetical protein
VVECRVVDCAVAAKEVGGDRTKHLRDAKLYVGTVGAF